MNTMLETMVENYKALIDRHKKDYERGYYESSVEEFREVLDNEYHKMIDVLNGMARYGGISWEDYSILSSDCLGYALRAGIV